MFEQITYLIILFASSIIAYAILIIIEPYDLIFKLFSRFIKNENICNNLSYYIDSFINISLTYIISILLASISFLISTILYYYF
jgi:hypothetical protein